MVALLLVTVIIGGCTGKAEPIDAADVEWGVYNENAEAFISAMAGGEFESATAMFDKTMARLIGVKELRDIWDDIVGHAGEFEAFHETHNAVHDGYFICDVTSRHERSGATMRVVFDKKMLVSGLFIQDYPLIEDAGFAPETTQREGFTDYPVVIGEGTEFPLPGILSMPDDAVGLVPAVVIVHGSGPNDMDLTIFGNKPYRDVAEYLAKSGIAVVRYNKRTFNHGAKFDGNCTVWDETIEDAILATRLIKHDPRIDENKVFIIGHSLGGILAPRIHAEGGDFAGLILLAGSPRFALDLSKDQNIAYINETMEGEERETALSQIAESWDGQVAALVGLPDDEAKNTPVEAGMSAYYFKDLYEHPAISYIENIDAPFMVLQGTMDSTVSADVDFALYKELLYGRPNVSFNLYEGLNHLFMPSTVWGVTKQSEDYAVEGKVDEKVLADIVAWILEK